MAETNSESGYTQSGKIVALDTPLGKDTLLLYAVNGEDALSRCFRYSIEFLTKAKDADVRSLIGRQVTIWLNNHKPDERQPINGLVRRIINRPSKQTGYVAYQAEIVPRLWFLECTTDCRIFQDMTYPDIIRQVLQEFGITHVNFKLFKTDYPSVEYCVQYRESALAFISRLMEFSGIYFYHDHGDNTHTLIITDSNRLTGFMTPQTLKLAHNNRVGDIETMAVETVFRPGVWSLSDYDFQGPTKLMRQTTQNNNGDALMMQLERFEFPGGYTDQSVGAWLTLLRMEEEEAQLNRMLGVGKVTSMLPGYRFDLDDGVISSQTAYLLTEVHHHARERSYLAGTEGGGSEYHNEFVAIPADVPYRPQRLTPKSIMRGAQTATVVSDDPDDPIMVDVYGRVKVHFHWDRYGQPSAGNTSCWVRVSQNSSGAGFGAISTPHAGQEVVVDFLEGDPDRPLIVGRVHNADKMPPLDLPGHKHKTITRDHGGNKFVMDGETGGRHLSMIAPGDLNMFAIGNYAQSLSAGAAASSAYSLPTIIFDPNPGNYSDLQTAINNAFSADSSSSSSSVSLSAKTTAGVEGSDSNSVTKGNANSFKGGNNNSWTMKMSFSYNGLGSMTITMLDSTGIVFGSNLSVIGGFDTKTVVGFSTSMIGGLNTSLVLGGDLKFVCGISETVIKGPILKWNSGATADIRHGNVLEIKNGKQYAFAGAKTDLVIAGEGAIIPSLSALMAALPGLGGDFDPITKGLATAKAVANAPPQPQPPPPNPDYTQVVTGSYTSTVANGWTTTVATGDVALTATAGALSLSAAAGDVNIAGAISASLMSDAIVNIQGDVICASANSAFTINGAVINIG
ncbi:MAG TPA: type VI secretion system tip protein TssI/VgrG [Acidocella sp.]|nr:type VI secretion system tip protein TssI/VgrG [Acidocella sp.]